MKNLTEHNGTFFNENTNEQVKNIICSLLHSEKRIRIYYGDIKTGKSWNEENDICGYVGQSTGIKPIPILINNKKSTGGGTILTDCIIKIVDIQSKKTLYKHPKFNQPIFEVRNYDCVVLADKKIHAQGFYTEKQALRYVDFMNGKRNNK